MRTKYVNSNGEQVPGVTTVLSVLNKPALIAWANRLGLQGIDSTKYKDALADVGQAAHYMILCHLNNEKPLLDDYSPNTIKQAENSFLSYLEWEKNHTIKPIRLEFPMVSDNFNYGGTPDFIGYIDDDLEIIDFKTGNGLWPEHNYQLAAYRQLAKESLELDINRARLLRIGRAEDEGFEEKVIKRFNQEFSLFWHCLSIYNIQKDLNK